MKDPTFTLSEVYEDREELTYIRKILTILLVQVISVSLISSCFILITPLFEFVVHRFWLAIVTKISLVPLGIILFEVEAVGRSLALSTIFGVLFTLFMGTAIGCLLALLGKTIGL